MTGKFFRRFSRQQFCQAESSQAKPGTIFVFLEIFSWEGGIQAYVQDLLAAYLRQEHPPLADVILLRDSARAYNPFESSALRFHYLASPQPHIGRLRMALTLALLLWRRRPQRVICGHIRLGRLVKTLCRWFGVPYTVITYGKEVWDPLPSAQQEILQDADQVWSISRYSRDRLCQVNRIPPHKIQLMPCVVDGGVFSPGEPDPHLVEKYDLSGHKVLMTVARLWSGDLYKGVDITIRALPTIANHVPQVKYLIIGRGDDQLRLAQLARTLGVADQVVFAGFVPAAALAAHYRLADAYVMPSQEGFGIVYLEAMACGVPVLSGDQDGSADPLQDGRLGWRVPHRDPEAVAAACLEILSGNDYRCNGAWLRQETVHRYSPQALAQRLRRALSVEHDPVNLRTPELK